MVARMDKDVKRCESGTRQESSVPGFNFLFVRRSVALIFAFGFIRNRHFQLAGFQKWVDIPYSKIPQILKPTKCRNLLFRFWCFTESENPFAYCLCDAILMGILVGILVATIHQVVICIFQNHTEIRCSREKFWFQLLCIARQFLCFHDDLF